jgi:hypothetical protein
MAGINRDKREKIGGLAGNPMCHQVKNFEMKN